MTDVTADTIALKIIVEADQAQRNIQAYGANVQRTMVAVEASTARASAAAATGAVKQSEAYRQLGQQLVGVAADALEGKNAFQILGQHGTAVAASLAGFGGVVGRVAGFLSGPWGAALITAASVIGMFATRTKKAEISSRQEGEAARNLGEAIDDLNKTSQASIKTREQIRFASRQAVQNYIAENRAARETAKGVLEVARAKLAEAKARSIDPTLAGDGGFNPGAVATTNLARQVKELETKIAGLDEEWVEGQVALRASVASEILDDIEAKLDPALAAMRRYENTISRLRDLHRVSLIGDAEFRKEAERLARERDRILDAKLPSFLSAAAGPESPQSKTRELTPAEIRAGIGDPPEEIPMVIAVEGFKLPTKEEAKAAAATLLELAGGPIDFSKFEIVDTKAIEKIAKINGELTSDLSKGLTDAIVQGKSLGDVLVDSFARAGQALIQAKILQLLDPAGDGASGFVKDAASIFGSLFGTSKAPGRASGGHVSAGQLYRVNEAGIEGFRPAGSGTIVPLGQMAAQPRGGGVTVIQPLNVSFAGAVTTPELMAEFKAYADSVGQAAAIGGAAMAHGRMARRAARALPR